MNEIRGKKILILGFGREGQSVKRFLAAHYPNIIINTADQKDGKDYLKHLNEYDTVIRSPGIPSRLQELVDYKKNSGWITTATNIFFSQRKGITMGVTGTKGKSTTASLTAHILKQKFSDVRLVGNIGSPMLDHLDGVTNKTIFVIELSSHQLEDIRYSPHIAILLPIVPEHLDYYASYDAYVRAKTNIIRFQTKKDVVIFHSTVKKIAETSLGKEIPIVDSKFSAPTLRGNTTNIQAAVTVAKYFDISGDTIKKSLGTFHPLPHRLEFVGEYKKIRFFNDSLATIPEATIHALRALGSDVETLIAGGFDRGLDYTILRDYLNKHPVKTLILFPDTGEKIGRDVSIQKFFVRSMEEAVKLAYKHTPKNKICLLSPASASFNLFKDYEDRGNQFKDWVRKLAR
ncbi:UDP-N-acetylmuramoylalanine--D-glutamate ligase [Candidatus Gottesmanbacteria bacterium RIFCSPLOWO2_01_FULL_43_11b]|uniref:UDP-N-acetylmuramoylalanine--D-glutamate ligase n=1 Tax=Candidatus Gottesmanbacteria bacterium RIFCSPLOWO2_01_FULL_43_11b TaxID=1798392 RepID=A0A1F6AH44_9BACT|nr:MAG: UDP-N-acetylmuramoylalanine--D-glutamate ligase [Candidatus Gottesmanbacteria bacterium RIFCSPLOWO2_01_FULL_43_11b]